MKLDGLRRKLNDWKERRKEDHSNVEMGEISRSDVGPLSMQAGLIGPPRVHTRRERC